MEFKMWFDGRGLINAPEHTRPKPAKLPKCPAWLASYSFYTNKSPRYFKGWTLTEASTGFGVVAFCKTRQEAMKKGLELILAAGQERWENEVAKAQKKIAGGIA